MVQGRGGTRRGWQTELSHIVLQNPRSFFFLLFSRNKGVLLPLHLSTNLISTAVTLNLEISISGLFNLFSPQGRPKYKNYTTTQYFPTFFLKKKKNLFITQYDNMFLWKKLDLQSLLLILLLQIVDIVILIIW